MDLLSLKRQWRRREYRRMRTTAGGSRKKMQIVRFGGETKRSWRIRSIPKLRRLKLLSPLKIWKKLKNAYTNMMLRVAGKVGTLNGGNAFAGKRISAARQVPLTYSKTEFENRLIYEICKSLVVSLELNS